MAQDERKIELILNEINECREDDRDAQEQILQTIAIGGAILGVLTGASFTDQTVVYIEWMFFLAELVFFIVFANVASLGIGTVVRYHYIRDLEDEMCRILGGPEEMIVFWKSFSSPVMTRNIKHVKNKYTLISFGAISLAAVCALLFCLLLMVVLFLQIQPLRFRDWVMGGSYLLGVMFVGTVFFYICSRGDKMNKYCRKMSMEARKKRLHSADTRAETEKKTKYPTNTLLGMIVYYLYPRLCDFQKPLLMVVGYVIGRILFGIREGETVSSGWMLLLSWFVVDFLIYQSRLLWNDIRGWQEDKLAGKTNRLPGHILGTAKAVRISMAVAAVKVLLALGILWLMPDELSWGLLVLIIVVAVTAVLYELATAKKCTFGVYALVSVGYPVRLLTGMLVAKPDLFTAPFVCCGDVFPGYLLVFLILAYGMLGMFSSIIAWAHQAVHQQRRINTVTKDYYRFLLAQLGDRTRKEEPMKEKGRLSDIWNIAYLLSVCALSAFICCAAGYRGIDTQTTMIILAEIVLVILVMAVCGAKEERILVFTAFTAVTVVVKAILMLAFGDWATLYIVVCVNQLFAVVMYFGLRYMFQPDFDFVKTCKDCIHILLILIIGKNTLEVIRQEKEEVCRHEEEQFTSV